jgi:hypothetical protein
VEEDHHPEKEDEQECDWEGQRARARARVRVRAQVALLMRSAVAMGHRVLQKDQHAIELM